MNEKKFNVFFLEVLENNIPAIRLYEKYGFRKIRKLECFEIEKNNISARSITRYTISDDETAIKRVVPDRYRLYPPSWQNTDESIKNNNKYYSFQAIIFNDQIICFGYIHRKRGDIPQIGILSEWKNHDIEMLLLFLLSNKIISEKIFVLNVEENNYLSMILKELGFENFLNQWEMKLELK